MKTSELDILIIPGWSGSGPGHWQTRWLSQLKTARLVWQDDWLTPTRDEWVEGIVQQVETSSRPALLVAHSLGCISVAHASARLCGRGVAGAFLVAPADVDRSDQWPVTNGYEFAKDGGSFAPIPRDPLPFPSALVASSNDPYCAHDRAGELALSWGAVLIEGGEVGHINSESGHGPWPEGLMRLGWFLKNLS